MTTTVFDPALPSSKRGPRGPRTVLRSPGPPRPLIGKLAVAAAVGGLVAVVGLGVATETRSELNVAGGPATFIGSLTGLVGMYLALLMVVLAARIPALERILGQDGMLRWHRRLAPWPISILVLHALFTTLGYAQAGHSGVLHEIAVLIDNYPDMLAATVGFALLVVIGVASIRVIRSRLRRETWWALHLYIYLALALSFAHVIALGPAFVGHPLSRIIWSLVWAATAGTVLVYRVGVPIARSLRHQLRVAEVRREGPDVVSVILTGRSLEKLAVAGGQFFAWRFLVRGLWWQAHPYSLSALPRPPRLRITVKQIGDHSAAVARLRPGTRVVVEGPYGAVTPDVRVHERVLLVAGGIGVTALRSLLEALPRKSNPVVVLRASSADDLVLREEVAELVRQRRGELHELVGPRHEIALTGTHLLRLAPDLLQRDVYVCGPPGMVEDVVAAAGSVGVAKHAIHFEIFSW